MASGHEPWLRQSGPHITALDFALLIRKVFKVVIVEKLLITACLALTGGTKGVALAWDEVSGD